MSQDCKVNRWEFLKLAYNASTIWQRSFWLLVIWMIKEVLGCEVNNEGYLINCFEKLSCKVINHQRKVEKSTVFETLS